MRLEQAKADLEAADPRTTVTGVAYDCGFGHLGRFALPFRPAVAAA